MRSKILLVTQFLPFTYPTGFVLPTTILLLLRACHFISSYSHTKWLWKPCDTYAKYDVWCMVFYVLYIIYCIWHMVYCVWCVIVELWMYSYVTIEWLLLMQLSLYSFMHTLPQLENDKKMTFHVLGEWPKL